MRRKPLLLALLGLCLLAVAGCSEVKLALHVVKKINRETKDTPATRETLEARAMQEVRTTHEAPATQEAPLTQPLPDAAEDVGYKLGKPYEIDQVWYFPSYEASYDQTGVASWYGTAFHGRPTAIGEPFDMNEVTAAHPTLPLPSRVRVTNLENGRQLVMRVNDRGPFIGDRVIDVSRRAAQLLGFYGKGLAEVRVEYLGLDHLEPDVPWPVDSPKIARVEGTPAPAVAFKPRRPQPAAATVAEAETQAAAETVVAPAPAAVLLPPTKPVRTAAARPPRAEDRREAGSSGTSRSRLLVEAAVLDGRDAADRLGDSMRTLGAVAVEPERRGDRMVYAVRIGPVDTDHEAAFILAELTRAGHTESHIVAAGYR